MLKAGCRYKNLKPCFIIFICPFDLYGLGRHIYTFRNLCVENPSLEMGDATTKIFLNTKGTMDDVTMDIKTFLDYINGTISEDDLVQEIECEIQRMKLLEEEEVSYMTYEMKLEEMREDGIQQGIQQGEGRLARLLSLLLSDGRNQEVQDVLTNEALRNQLYIQYNIQ